MTEQPTVEQILTGMSASLNGSIPNTIQLATTVMPDIIQRHVQDSGYAMPKGEGAGALTEETRTLIYLGIALATGSTACIESMTNKAQALHIDTDKLLETFKIARFAEATRVLANAETLFAKIATTP